MSLLNINAKTTPARSPPPPNASPPSRPASPRLRAAEFLERENQQKHAKRRSRDRPSEGAEERSHVPSVILSRRHRRLSRAQHQRHAIARQPRAVGVAEVPVLVDPSDRRPSRGRRVARVVVVVARRRVARVVVASRVVASSSRAASLVDASARWPSSTSRGVVARASRIARRARARRGRSSRASRARRALVARVGVATRDPVALATDRSDRLRSPHTRARRSSARRRASERAANDATTKARVATTTTRRTR